MKTWSDLKARYQRDNPAVQLGGLASNLNRIAWCAQRNNPRDAGPLFRESKYFAEWAAASCSVDQQILLADVQFQLAAWEQTWGNRLAPAIIAQKAQALSAKLLESSGLLTT